MRVRKRHPIRAVQKRTPYMFPEERQKGVPYRIDRCGQSYIDPDAAGSRVPESIPLWLPTRDGRLWWQPHLESPCPEQGQVAASVRVESWLYLAGNSARPR